MYYNNKMMASSSRSSYPYDNSYYNKYGPGPVQCQKPPRNYNQSPKKNNHKHPNYNQFREKPNPNIVDYKLYKCPGCSCYFDCTNRNNRFTGRVPLILNCNHTTCQECIYKGAITNNIKCPTCKEPSEIANKNLIDNLQEAFTPNFYVIGIILFGKPMSWNRHPTLVPAEVSLCNRRLGSTVELQAEPESGETCCFLSCSKRAVMRCQDCNDVYCSECCTIVHKSAKSLWSHVQVPIAKVKFSAELEKCQEHEMDIEFFCKTCETGSCCYCFIDKHEGHEREYLSKLNEKELCEFDANRDKAELILKKIIISQKKLKDLQDSNISTVETKVRRQFADIHAQVCTIESRVLKEFLCSRSTTESIKGLDSISSSLNSSFESLKTILTACNYMSPKKVNLRSLHSKLKDVLDTPCYLTCKNDRKVSPAGELKMPPGLLNSLELISIEKPTECEFVLLSADDLPSDYKDDPSDQQYESDADSCINSFFHSAKKEESNQQNKRISQQLNLSQSNKQSSQSNRKSVKQHIELETVEVTHIESLECFYVQMKKTKLRLIQMNDDIENYIKMGASSVKDPLRNELYLAQYVTKNEKMWCRGRLVDVKPGRNQQLYEVFFIDYGSTQTLDINKLREITSTLAQRKAFAMQCELYNPTYANWGKNTHVHMGKVIYRKDVYMMVKSISNGIHQVDLMVSSSDGGLTSIVDILLNTYSNALSSSSETSSVTSRKESYVPEHKIFGNSIKFRKNQVEHVIIANVIDPHHIFVHIEAHVGSLRKMNSLLKQYYKNSQYDSCIPIEGTYVVVEHKDPIRGNWHRALIKKVDTNAGLVHVMLIDWGTNVVVMWGAIRLLTEAFTKLESQAILIKLAHVEPYESKHVWDSAAASFLLKNFRTQETLKMIVHNVEPLEVALFEVLHNLDICLNAQLVEEKLADATGKISQTLEWPHDQEEKGFTEDEGFVATLLKKLDEENYEDEEVEDDKTALRAQVEIVKVVSPDLIYLKFCLQESLEDELYKELQIAFSKERKTLKKWKTLDDCAVLFNNTYTRGKILEKVGVCYKVNVYDKATELTLPIQKIFQLPKYFNKYPSIVFKAHLADIRPAGGDKWSLSSIEALQRTFDKYKDIFATKMKGDESKKCLPMHMWYTQVRLGGALEPSITKFISINNLLVKLGFAYKKQPLVEDMSKPAEDDAAKTDSVKADAVLPSDIIINELQELMIETQSKETNEEKVEADVPVDTMSIEEETPLLKKTSSEESDGQPNVSSDWNDLIEEETKKDASEQDSPYHTREADISDWIPAFPIKEREFNAWITCAETEGILYLREKELQTVYKRMESNLKEYFESKPPLKENNEWHPGDICTIAYNGLWYRGKILKVNSPTDIVAIMIDFGSDHNLSPKQLFKEILYPEIEAFASKIKLDRVYAKTGVWLSSDYETLLDIVTEYAKVVIKGPLDVDVPFAEVYTDKGISVNQTLVSKCPNLTRCIKSLDANKSDDEENVVIEDEESLGNIYLEKENPSTDKEILVEIDTTKLEFKVEPLPVNALEDKTVMTIVGVLSYNSVVFKRPEDTYKNELFSLVETIQGSLAGQPVVEHIELGMPCICPYAEDGVWYRAKIHDIGGLDCGYVFVFFVDFGNVESVSAKEVKMMKPEWFDLPVSCYVATLNFELKTNNHLEHVFQHMKKLMGKNKLIEIVSDNPLTINLFENNGDLCYMSLLNNGLLRVK